MQFVEQAIARTRTPPANPPASSGAGPAVSVAPPTTASTTSLHRAVQSLGGVPNHIGPPHSTAGGGGTRVDSAARQSELVTSAPTSRHTSDGSADGRGAAAAAVPESPIHPPVAVPQSVPTPSLFSPASPAPRRRVVHTTSPTDDECADMEAAAAALEARNAPPRMQPLDEETETSTEILAFSESIARVR